MGQTRLEVMTLNTWGFPWPLARHRAARFRRIAEHLANCSYDIVALQEVWNGAAEVLGQTPLSWIKRPQWLQRLKGHSMVESGLGVKVAPRLTDQSQVNTEVLQPYRDHASFDRFKRKGVFAADIELPGGGGVTVLNTHLQAGKRYGRTRRSQLEQLLEAAEQVTNPIVLMGDFNFHSDGAEDRAAQAQLERAGFVDAGQSLDRPEPTYLNANPYVPRSDEDERFDRIFVRDGSEARIEAEEIEVLVDHSAPMSDHEAVAARIIITTI